MLLHNYTCVVFLFLFFLFLLNCVHTSVINNFRQESIDQGFIYRRQKQIRRRKLARNRENEHGAQHPFQDRTTLLKFPGTRYFTFDYKSIHLQILHFS